MRSFQLLIIGVCVAGAVWRLTSSLPTTPPKTPPAAPAPQQPIALPAPTPSKQVIHEEKPKPLIDEPAPEIVLTTGRILHDVLAINFMATAVSVSHRDGKQIIAYEQFPLEYREALIERIPKSKAPDPKEEARKAALAREKELKKAEQARMERDTEKPINGKLNIQP